jgi:phosphatidylserine decarboxylase
MSLFETFQRSVPLRFHPAGYPFIGGGLLASIVFLLIWDPLGVIFLLLTLFCLYFFRDPNRAVPQRDGLVVAPADGRIVDIQKGQSLPDDLIEEDDSDEYTKISIFLSVLDVHVNRIPISGKILKTFYYEGRFLNAELDKASEENERACALVKTEKEQLVAFTQIAGLVARRIITNLDENQMVTTGERFGIIRFGSRTDVYVPKKAGVLVSIGQRTIGGETVLADFESSETNRIAKVI